MLRKVSFVVKGTYYTTKMGLESDKEYTGYLHGIFQTQDGDTAEPIAVIELEENGKIVEISPSSLTMLDKPVNTTNHITEAIDRFITAFMDGDCRIRII